MFELWLASTVVFAIQIIIGGMTTLMTGDLANGVAIAVVSPIYGLALLCTAEIIDPELAAGPFLVAVGAAAIVSCTIAIAPVSVAIAIGIASALFTGVAILVSAKIAKSKGAEETFIQLFIPVLPFGIGVAIAGIILFRRRLQQRHQVPAM